MIVVVSTVGCQRVVVAPQRELTVFDAEGIPSIDSRRYSKPANCGAKVITLVDNVFKTRSVHGNFLHIILGKLQYFNNSILIWTRTRNQRSTVVDERDGEESITTGLFIQMELPDDIFEHFLAIDSAKG